jgi:hypothetical protein
MNRNSGSGVHGSGVCLTKKAGCEKNYELKRHIQDVFG